MARFRHHKYTYCKPFTHASHTWELVGPEGGIHFHVSIDPDGKYGPTAGLEFHHAARANYDPNRAPDHIKCPLIGEPCWHDGTSLYASETLWPMVEPMLFGGNHEGVFRLLEHEYDRHFKSLAEDREDA